MDVARTHDTIIMLISAYHINKSFSVITFVNTPLGMDGFFTQKFRVILAGLQLQRSKKQLPCAVTVESTVVFLKDSLNLLLILEHDHKGHTPPESTYPNFFKKRVDIHPAW